MNARAGEEGKTAGAGAAVFINDGAGASQEAVVNAEQAGELWSGVTSDKRNDPAGGRATQ